MSKNVNLRPGYTKYSLYIQKNIHRLNRQNTLSDIFSIYTGYSPLDNIDN